jgi:hypothetical protein
MKIIALLLVALLSSCTAGQVIYTNSHEPIRNTYEVIAPMRITFKVSDSPRYSTIDHLLTEARKMHGTDVDIKNLSKDVVDGVWEVYNFYVVRYNRLD